MLNIDPLTVITKATINNLTKTNAAAVAKISNTLTTNETSLSTKQTITTSSNASSSPLQLSFLSSSSSTPNKCIYKKLKWIQHCLWIYLIIGFCSPKCKFSLSLSLSLVTTMTNSYIVRCQWFAFNFSVCFAGINEKRLLHDLLDTYNTLERPVVNESDPLQISFGLTLMQIIDVDEKNQMLVTNIWLKLVSFLSSILFSQHN